MSQRQELTEKLKAMLEEARQIAEKAEERGSYTGEEMAKVKAIADDAKGVRQQLDSLNDGDGLQETLKALGESLGYTEEKAPPANSFPPAKRYATAGMTFVESPQYKAFVKQFPGGRIPERMRINIDPVAIKSDPEPPTGESNGAGGLISITGMGLPGSGIVPPDLQGIVDMLGRNELHMRDLFNRGSTTSDLIEYVRQLTRANNAGWVPEATSIDDDEALKPMGGFTFEVVTTPVGTIAEWIPITKRALMDAAMLRGIIDTEIREDLAEAEEVALLYGGGDFEGLDEVSGIQSQAFDTDLLTTTRRAISKVRYGGFAQPSAFLMNVQDDENIDLLRGDDGHFFGNGPWSMGPNTLWGLPRVVSPWVHEGEAWVADWRRATIWDRSQATITATDSHADFFVRNLVAVLGEERKAFGVIRPSAFVKIATSS